MRRFFPWTAAAALAAITVAACSTDDGVARLGGPRQQADAVGDRNDVYEIVPGVLNVCAFYPGNVNGMQPPASFTASAPAGEDVLGGVFTIVAPPHCIEVWNATHAGTVAVSATLTTPASGWQVDRVYRAIGDGVNPETATWFDGATSATANVSSTIGGYIWFKFKPADVPPPTGGQGCTPGYWRQPHHFSRWPAPYTPTTPFSAVFANAFPGKTLHDVVKLGGGGLNALGRMAVASLLSAASPDVNFDLTVQEVINAFNNNYNAPKARIENTKNVLDMLLNQGCPL